MTGIEVSAVAIPTGAVLGWLGKQYAGSRNGNDAAKETIVALTKIATVLDVQTLALTRLYDMMLDHDRRVFPAIEGVPRIVASVEKLSGDFTEHAAADVVTFADINRRLDSILAKRARR